MIKVALGLSLMLAIGSRQLAELFVESFPTIVAKVISGKFPDSALFVHHRLLEGALIAWIILGSVALGQWWLIAIRNLPRRTVPLAVGFGWFVLANIAVGMLSPLALSWMFLYRGAPQTLVQVKYKAALFWLNPYPRKGIVLGNSQAQAQIGEELLNQALGGKYWFSEFHYPGSVAWDIDLLGTGLLAYRPNLVIIYLSPLLLYNQKESATTREWMSWGMGPEMVRLGMAQSVEAKTMLYIGLGLALPLFRYRDAIAYGLLGPEIIQVSQEEALARREKDTETILSGFSVSAWAEIQKEALRLFIERAEQAGAAVVLISGQLNPQYQEKLPLAVRTDYAAFVADLAGRFPRLAIVEHAALARQTAADYLDYAHVNVEGKRRFSKALAAWLSQRFDTGS